MFQTFNNHQIRRFILAFGSFFDSIYVTREDESNVIQQTILVPLEYGPKERWLYRLTQDPDLLRGVGQVVPRLAYELTSIGYDGSRKLKTMNQLKFPSIEAGKMARTWGGVPYNLTFELTALTKYQADGFQITEQILPYFTPDLTFAIQTLPGIGIVDTIPFSLNSVTHSDNYEGDFEKRRIILWTFGFTMKVFFYGPTRTQGRIEEVQVDLYNSPYLDLVNPPYYIADETGDFVTNEDTTLLATENTSNTYLTTGLVERVTVVPDPVDQDPLSGNVHALTTVEYFDGGIRRSRTMTDEELG